MTDDPEEPDDGDDSREHGTDETADSTGGDDSPNPFAFDEERPGDDDDEPVGDDEHTGDDEHIGDDDHPAVDGDAPADIDQSADMRTSGADDAPRIENPFSSDSEPTQSTVDADASSAEDADEDTAETDATDRRDAPFGDLASEVGERRRRRRDDSDPFEQVDVGELDEEELWSALAGDDGDSTGGGVAATAAEPAANVGAAVGAPTGRDDRTDHVVDKRQYCQRCRFFSAPPEVSCGHDGTDIVEAVDLERFRVRGCPMVTEGGRPNFAAGDDVSAEGTDVTGDTPVADGTVGDADRDGSVAGVESTDTGSPSVGADMDGREGTDGGADVDAGDTQDA